MADESGHERMVPLEELGSDALAEGERDVSGWNVMAADGTHVGDVDGVLVGADERRIRYLEVNVARYLSPGREPRHVLIPMSYARVVPQGETVLVERLRCEDITNLPPYRRQPASRDYDVEFSDRFGDRFRAEPVEESGFLGPQVDVDPDAHR